MSHVASQHTTVVPAHAEGAGPARDLAVDSALKATLDRELVLEASAPGGAPAPQHMAGPGRLAPAAAHP
jgi:hypothetical protein